MSRTGRLLQIIRVLSGSSRKIASLIISSFVLVGIVTPGTVSAYANQTIACSDGGSFSLLGTSVRSGGSCGGTAVIPDSATELGRDSFLNATQLRHVIFSPNSQLNAIRMNTFYNAKSLESIEIPAGVTVIEVQSFHQTDDLDRVTFAPNSQLQLIEDYTFWTTGLREITIPDGVTIESSAFHNARNLKKVYFLGDAPTISGSGRGFDVSLTVPTGYIKSSASGFSAAGQIWDGVRIAIADLSVTYAGNGADSGTVPIDQRTFASGDSVIAASNSGQLAKSGSVLQGWNTQSDGDGTSVAATGLASFTMPANNTVLYAVWSAISYTLTLDNEGSTVSQSLTKGATPTDPFGSTDRSGFTLSGWSQTNGGSVDFQADLSDFNMGSGNETLYAVWSATQAEKKEFSATTTPEPYRGPYFTTATVYTSAGESLEIAGERLSSISKAEIDNTVLEILALDDSQMVIRIPTNVPAGKFDLRVTSAFGVLTHQSLIVVKESALDLGASRGLVSSELDSNLLGLTFVVPRSISFVPSSEGVALGDWLTSKASEFLQGTVVCTLVSDKRYSEARTEITSPTTPKCPEQLKGHEDSRYRFQVKTSEHTWFHNRLLITFARK